MEPPSRKRRLTAFEDVADDDFKWDIGPAIAPSPLPTPAAPAVIILDSDSSNEGDDDDPMDVDVPPAPRRIAPIPIARSSEQKQQQPQPQPGFAMPTKVQVEVMPDDDDDDDEDGDISPAAELMEAENVLREEALYKQMRQARDIARNLVAQEEQRDIIAQIIQHTANHPFPLPSDARDLTRAKLTLKFLEATGDHYTALAPAVAAPAPDVEGDASATKASKDRLVSEAAMNAAMKELGLFETLQVNVVSQEGILGAALVSGYLQEVLRQIALGADASGVQWKVPTPLFARFDGTREERDAQYQASMPESGFRTFAPPTPAMIETHEFRSLEQYFLASANLIPLDIAIEIYQRFLFGSGHDDGDNNSVVWAPVDVGIDNVADAVETRRILRDFASAGSPPTFEGAPLLKNLFAWLNNASRKIPLDEIAICRDLFDAYIKLLANPEKSQLFHDDKDDPRDAQIAVAAGSLHDAIDICDAIADLCKIKFYRAPRYRAKRQSDFIAFLKQLKADDYRPIVMDFPIFRNALDSMLEKVAVFEQPQQQQAHATGAAADELTEAIGLWSFFNVLYRNPRVPADISPLFTLSDTQAYFAKILETGQLPSEYIAAAELAKRVLPDAFRDIADIAREKQLAELAKESDEAMEETTEATPPQRPSISSPSTDACDAILEPPPSDDAAWMDAWNVPTEPSSYTDALETYMEVARSMSLRYRQCVINKELEKERVRSIPSTEDVMTHMQFAQEHLKRTTGPTALAARRVASEIKEYKAAAADGPQPVVLDTVDADTIASVLTKNVMKSPVMRDLSKYAFAYWNLMYSNVPANLKSVARNPLLSDDQIRAYVTTRESRTQEATFDSWNSPLRALFRLDRLCESMGDMMKRPKTAALDGMRGVTMRSGTLGIAHQRAAAKKGAAANTYNVVRADVEFARRTGQIGSLCIIETVESLRYNEVNYATLGADTDTHLPAKFFEFRHTFNGAWNRTVQIILVALPIGLRFDTGYTPIALVVYDTDIDERDGDRMESQMRTAATPERLSAPLFMSAAAIKWGNYSLLVSGTSFEEKTKGPKGFGVYSTAMASKNKERKSI